MIINDASGGMVRASASSAHKASLYGLITGFSSVSANLKQVAGLPSSTSGLADFRSRRADLAFLAKFVSNYEEGGSRAALFLPRLAVQAT